MIIEQDAKVQETINAVKPSIVGIFKKKATSSTIMQNLEESTGFNLDESYVMRDELAQGFVMTSDGWVISNYAPPELIQTSVAPVKMATTAKDKIFSNYAIITKDKKIYQVDNIVFSKLSPCFFWHIAFSSTRPPLRGGKKIE